MKSSDVKLIAREWASILLEISVSRISMKLNLIQSFSQSFALMPWTILGLETNHKSIIQNF